MRGMRVLATLVGPMAVALAILPVIPAQASESPAAEVQRFVDDNMDSHHVPGVVFVMVAGGEIVAAGTHGLADVATGREMSLDTPLRVGSISKPVTAALSLLAAERGAVDLDVPVDRYLDVDLSDHYGPASSIRQILTHRAGYPDVFVGTHHLDPDAATSLEDWVEEAPPRALQPDVVASYSSAGFNLVGAALEKTSGMTFDDLATDLLFEPAGMHGASFSTVVPDDVAVGYEWNGEAFVPRPVDSPDLIPGAGLVATGRDMAGFMIAILDDRGPLPEPVRVSLLDRQGPEPGLRGYSLGFTEWRHGSHTVLYHEGNGIGTTSRMVILPDHGIGLFTAVNGDALTGLGEPSGPTRFIRDLQDHIITSLVDPTVSAPAPHPVTSPFPPAGEVGGTYVPTRVDTTSPLRLEALISQLDAETTSNGVRFGSAEYVEAASGAYVSGSHRLVFLEGEDGRVYATRGGTDSYRSAAWWETMTVNLVAVGAALLVVMAGAIVAARRAPRPLRAIALLTASITFTWIALVGYGLMSVEVMELFTGLPAAIEFARWLALAGLLTAAGSAVLAVHRWWRSGGDPGVVSALAIGIAGMSLGVWANVWRLLPV